MSLSFTEYPDRETLYASLARILAAQLGQRLRTGAGASLCVPGGTTPGPVLDLLSATDLDWANVTVLATDERWVDGENPRSNGRLLRRRLLRDKAGGARYIDLFTGAAQPSAAVAGLSPRVEALLPLTVTLLGMGADMHIASLFPGAASTRAGLAPDAPAVIAVEDHAEARITLSARVLAGSRNLHLLITGADKRAAFERAQTLDPIDAPVRAVMGDLAVHWAE